MGMTGALGKMNLTSSSLSLLRQFSTWNAHPWPESPRPCEKMTVAVCVLTAGNTNGGL